MPDEMVSLEAAGMQANELVRGLEGSFVPLALAAAITFHQAHGNSNAIVSREDYDDALNIAAAALSRLIPLYELKDPKVGRERLLIDLTRQRFARGATQVRIKEVPVAGELSIRFADLRTAVALIRSAGLPFSFTLSAGSAAPAGLSQQSDPSKPRV